MKLEYLTVESIKNGMKEVVTRFGADAVLLKTLKEGSKYRLLVAHADDKPVNQQDMVKPTGTIKRPSFAPDVKPLTLAEIDLVTGERRVVLDPPRLTPASAQTLKAIVQDESVTARRERKFDTIDQAIAKNKVGEITSLTNHPDFNTLNDAFNTTGISSLFRHTTLSGLADIESEDSLQEKTVEFIASKLPTTSEIDLSQPLHFLAGGYGAGKTSLAFRMALQINSLEPGRAIVVNYSSNQESSWTAAAIMGARLGVEVLPSSSVADLAKIVRENRPSKLLLIDISTYNEGEIAVLQSSFDTAAFHLVAPIDACLTNLQRLSRAHSWSSLMITRLDSASFSWSIYQVLIESQIPLSIGSRDPSLNASVVVVSAEHLRSMLDSALRSFFARKQKATAEHVRANPNKTVRRRSGAQKATAVH